jgi:hypothetical protein
MKAVQSILHMLSDTAGEEQLIEARNSLLHLRCLPLLSRNSSAIRTIAFTVGTRLCACAVAGCVMLPDSHVRTLIITRMKVLNAAVDVY